MNGIELIMIFVSQLTGHESPYIVYRLTGAVSVFSLPISQKRNNT